jgi:hypothetical protein
MPLDRARPRAASPRSDRQTPIAHGVASGAALPPQRRRHHDESDVIEKSRVSDERAFHDGSCESGGDLKKQNKLQVTTYKLLQF